MTSQQQTDITNTDLSAALLDQKVAGAFHGKTYAFTTVVADDGWQLGVAVANEPGYSPIVGKSFKSEKDAREFADGMNAHIHLTRDEVIGIVISTMGGRPYRRAA